MVGFKNRYMVMEIFLHPNKDLMLEDPINVTRSNVSKAINDSILVNFGECGLASSFGSFMVKYVNPITKLCIIRASREDYQKVWCAIAMVTSIGNCPVLLNLIDLSGSIKACRKAALSCEEAKFEQYKLVRGGNVKDELNRQMQSFLEKIKVLEH
ncbi:putative ribonuclease P/MRP protein subunit POP5 [Bienertia sinuspersici]